MSPSAVIITMIFIRNPSMSFTFLVFSVRKKFDMTFRTYKSSVKEVSKVVIMNLKL